VLWTAILFAEQVTVLWQSGDLSSFLSTFATALAATMGVGYSMQPSLTIGAKIGIALGAVIGFAAPVSAMIILCRRKSKKAWQGKLPAITVELSGNFSGLKKTFRGIWRAVMDGTSPAAELDSRIVFVMPGPPVELEAPQHAQVRFSALY